MTQKKVSKKWILVSGKSEKSQRILVHPNCGNPDEGECLYVLNMYPAMVFGDHEDGCSCVCALKMYPAMVYGDNEGE